MSKNTTQAQTCTCPAITTVTLIENLEMHEAPEGKLSYSFRSKPVPANFCGLCGAPYEERELQEEVEL